ATQGLLEARGLMERLVLLLAEPGCWLYNSGSDDCGFGRTVEKLTVYLRHLLDVAKVLSLVCRDEYSSDSHSSDVDRRDVYVPDNENLKLAAVFPYPCTSDGELNGDVVGRCLEHRGDEDLEVLYVNLLKDCGRWMSAGEFESLVLGPMKTFVGIQLERMGFKGAQKGEGVVDGENHLSRAGSRSDLPRGLGVQDAEKMEISTCRLREGTEMECGNEIPGLKLRSGLELFVAEAAEEITDLVADIPTLCGRGSDAGGVLFDILWIASPNAPSHVKGDTGNVDSAVGPRLTLSMPITEDAALPLFGALFEARQRYPDLRISIWCPDSEADDFFSSSGSGEVTGESAPSAPGKDKPSDKASTGVEAPDAWKRNNLPLPSKTGAFPGEWGASGSTGGGGRWWRWSIALRATIYTLGSFTSPERNLAMRLAGGASSINPDLLWRGSLKACTQAREGGGGATVGLGPGVAGGDAKTVTDTITLGGIAFATSPGAAGLLSRSCLWARLVRTASLRVVGSIPMTEFTGAATRLLLAGGLPELRLIVEDPAHFPGTASFLHEWSSAGQEALVLTSTRQGARSGKGVYQ
ncbi:unnamed protein product, partial [Discosporangium mesarthrocarpum]